MLCCVVFGDVLCWYVILGEVVLCLIFNLRLAILCYVMLGDVVLL